MKSKAPLAMMEQMVMLLVFALAAALCLQAFVKSDRMSTEMEDRDRAMTLCQNAAETIRSTGGSFEEAGKLLGADDYNHDLLMVNYKADWTRTDGSVRYTLAAGRMETGVSGLGKASIWVRDEADNVDLFRLEVAWQEVENHG